MTAEDCNEKLKARFVREIKKVTIDSIAYVAVATN